MKQTKIMMDMPITVEIVDNSAAEKDLKKIFAYFDYIDNKFSTFKNSSEITKINQGKLRRDNYSQDMQTLLALAAITKKETNGYFDIQQKGKLDPSGVVKGWAINESAKLLTRAGFRNFYIEAGGDIQVSGKNQDGESWKIGIRNPFSTGEIVKALVFSHNEGVATSGTYERGLHIYNPKTQKPVKEIVSLTVIGPDIYEADRFATAAFAMGRGGIYWIEKMPGLEGYLIDSQGMATFTSGFGKYVLVLDHGITGDSKEAS